MAIKKLNNHYSDQPDLVYSSYQTRIFSEIEKSDRNLIVEAVAGSGKTTTIVTACSMLSARESHCFLAFNKKIADELSSRLPPHVPASTIHSMCLRILRNNYQKVKVSGGRVRQLLYKKVGAKTNTRMRDWYYENQRDVCTVVSRLKSMAIENPDMATIAGLIFNLDLDMPDSPANCSIILEVFYESIEFDGEDNIEIDFDDMIYHVVMRADTLTFPTYDTVVVDEAQDLNAGQRYLMGHLMGKQGRIIAVGDTAQAIYGFRGADHFSMRNMQESFDCVKLPLSICYRCPTKVVELAKHFVPEIEARDNAPEGVVDRVLNSDYRFMISSGDYMLCRTWAPLMREAMRLARNGHNVCMLGKDMAPTLIKWAKGVADLYDGINHSTIWDYNDLQECGIPETQEWKKYALQEKSKMLDYICEGTTLTLKEVESIIKELFTEVPPDSPHVLLSTIHRVKGGEANRVFILRPDLMPHPLATSYEEKVQEDNLHYVAITRAKKELWYIDEDER